MKEGRKGRTEGRYEGRRGGRGDVFFEVVVVVVDIYMR